ncbi:hypothetical protein F9278_15180 [Streptomyces phaeolivaceus]|uniref:Uncharacterized protein n=1 Tax=Streptomyces phaeolivaceus TaxID=2653200 RepID=A0A5P8K3I0_9ACTN|nr:hypothetical protein [Streptomyces phaeolivaceus]QFQ97328.1 hypothetical protein F9278_15180 [Streptomyces phaeolivaceus]
MIASAPEPWGDKAKAARILEVLPPYADWLKTLRTQQFFVVSGRVNRLIHEAADALRNDPLGFIDLELKQAAAAFSQAAVQLSEEMINLLFADRAETEAYERLSVQEKEDAWRFVVGEHQPGEDERRLHTLRNDFFETYDILVCLLNERLLAPGQAAAPTAPDTSAAVAESVAVPDTVGPQPRVGQGLPLHEHDLLGAHYQLRSAGLGQPTTGAYLHRVTAVQHFAAREGSGPGWVLTLRKGRAIAVSEPLWRALLTAGHPAGNGDPLAAVGYPTAAGTDSVVLGSDVERFALEGGDWGPGCLVRTDRDWRWEPQEDVGFNQTPSARNWMALQPAPQLRVRAVVTLPWDQAGGLEITPARRRELAQALPISRFAGAVTMLSLRRGADLPASDWQLGPHRNASDSLSYSATITAEGGRPVLAGAVMVALPGALQSHTVTCAEITIQDAAAWAAVLPSGSSTKLTLEEVEAVLLAAWETAADLLPAVVRDETTIRWAGAPTVELRLSAEGPHDQPRAGLGTLIDVRALGRTDRSSLSEMAVTIKGSPMLETTERHGRLRRALVHMVQRFGYVEADGHLFG